MQKYQTTIEEIGMRLDQYLSKQMNISRNKAQDLIQEKKVWVNSKPSKSSYSIKENDTIETEEYQEMPMDVKPEPMDLDIIYEDNDLLVVNKANGIVVHPAVGNPTGTLVNGLLYHSKNLSSINGEFRPGIVHRIDADTTGLLVVAKNNKTHEHLAKQLEEKTTHRKYIALVWGVVNTDTGTIDAPIGRDLYDRKKMAVTDINSKHAITHFKVLERFSNCTLIELSLETGRTHQIRVHMNYIGYPIVNDPVYGKRKRIDDSGQCLHAKELGFIHPTTGKYVEFHCELPTCFINIMKMITNS